MIIGFDFDRVLFKTDEFKEFLDKKIPEFLEKYPETGNYDPEEHAEKLEVNEKEIFSTLGKAEKFVYKDLETLEYFPERFELVIVSRGDPKFQKRKIKESGVLEYFEDFFIVEEMEKDSVEIDFLVDDKEKEIEEVNVPGHVFDRSEQNLEDLKQIIVEKLGESQ